MSSWSGHTYDVLTHLALISKEAILQYLSPIKLSERNLYRQQCEAQLDVALKAFFLISADSCSESTTNNFSAYSKPLPDLPSFLLFLSVSLACSPHFTMEMRRNNMSGQVEMSYIVRL